MTKVQAQALARALRPGREVRRAPERGTTGNSERANSRAWRNSLDDSSNWSIRCRKLERADSRCPRIKDLRIRSWKRARTPVITAN